MECGVPSAGSDIILHYNSTVEGSVLKFSCGNGFVPNEVLTAVCNKSGYWFPDPTKHICSTLSSGNSLYNKVEFGIEQLIF